jgi:hypothetical protein
VVSGFHSQFFINYPYFLNGYRRFLNFRPHYILKEYPADKLSIPVIHYIRDYQQHQKTFVILKFSLSKKRVHSGPLWCLAYSKNYLQIGFSRKKIHLREIKKSILFLLHKRFKLSTCGILNFRFNLIAN